MWKKLAALVTCTVFVSGCEPTGTGDVSVLWAVGLTGSCSDASLERVAARLETTDGILVARQDEYCQAGSARFLNVPVGSFRARLVGYDEQGVEAYESLVPGIVVQEGSEGGPYLGRLAPRPGEIGLVWYFRSGRLCSAYDVSRIVVRLFVDDTEVASDEYSCDRGDALLGNLHPGTYDLRVEGEDSRGVVSHAFLRGGLVLRPGHHVELDAPLDECGPLCL
jgi:hypothetical protein